MLCIGEQYYYILPTNVFVLVDPGLIPYSGDSILDSIHSFIISTACAVLRGRDKYRKPHLEWMLVNSSIPETNLEQTTFQTY